MTESDRMGVLRGLGYTETEAAFLSLAALHGGYFLRRQVSQFLGRQDGGTVNQLTQKALARKHVRASTWRQNTQLYHLCSRPFYRALGQEDNRNRRRREVSTIKNKIVGLDFVLAHRHVHYLATEQEKLDYFTGHLKLDPSTLPTTHYSSPRNGQTTARYFVDKYPVFLAQPPREGVSPLASFCFVDEGMASLSRFETYLAQYARLFVSLPQFHLVYVAANNVHIGAAGQMFARFLNQGSTGLDDRSGLRDVERLLEYFKARRLYDAQQFAAFDRAQLIRLREGREAFSSPDHEALFARWQAVGDGGLREILTPKRPPAAPIQGTFSTCVLEHDYGLFGSFAPF